MDDGRRHPDPAATDLPRARVTRRRWSAALVWLVPVAALAAAGWLLYDHIQAYGPEITIRFRDGGGVRPAQTAVRYRGVQIGEVTEVALSEDHRHVEVDVRLQRSAASIARAGALFWIVRPEVGIGNISGLSTVITGPEIQALPGTGDPASTFAGLESPPAGLELRGLKIVLRARSLGSLQPNSPVYYRGVEVGVVQETTLAPDATAANVHVLIRSRYAPLVRANSVFWNASGARVSGGLLQGIELKLESLRSLAAGGINFATPNRRGRRAREGEVFQLHVEGRKEWLSWTPRIPLPRVEGDGAAPNLAPAAGAAVEK
jgi:paraquat-inducible protein B